MVPMLRNAGQEGQMSLVYQTRRQSCQSSTCPRHPVQESGRQTGIQCTRPEPVNLPCTSRVTCNPSASSLVYISPRAKRTLQILLGIAI